MRLMGLKPSSTTSNSKCSQLRTQKTRVRQAGQRASKCMQREGLIMYWLRWQILSKQKWCSPSLPIKPLCQKCKTHKIIISQEIIKLYQRQKDSTFSIRMDTPWPKSSWQNREILPQAQWVDMISRTCSIGLYSNNNSTIILEHTTLSKQGQTNLDIKFKSQDLWLKKWVKLI